MAKFKIDDIVKVRSERSTDSRKLNGQIGRIREVKITDCVGIQKYYYILDIEDPYDASGIWEDELILVSSEKKEVKRFGIVDFCNKYYK